MQIKKIGLFLLGDFQSDNGPGMANKSLLESLKEGNIYNLYYSVAGKKVTRIIELVLKIWKSDILFICSASKINYIAIELAKLLRKKIIYLVHGYVSYENKLNNPSSDSKALKLYERFIFANVDKIVCVSKFAMDFMKKDYQEHQNKFCYIYNTIYSIDQLIKPFETETNNNKYVMSSGGARGEKKTILLQMQ